MAVSDSLLSFVKESLAQGVSRDQIEEVLLKANWTSEDVRSALAQFADIDFQIPVPRPKPYLSAREAFLYLLLFGTMYFCASNLGTLVFQLIDRAFPDPEASEMARQVIADTIRWSASSLIVALPVFLFMSWYTAGEIRRDPSKHASKIRRWLTYLTLFVAAATLIGDLTTLVYTILSGDLTARFILKVLTVGLISGCIFAYYLRDLRKDEI